ncbi:MAG: PDZ domain-containing protein [Chloroflexales bacterium]|nr:PDZ domain-containing protein [Chloroflexales bacterium]
MGAQAAGLQKDDVIVSINGQAIIDFPTLATALDGCQAGDTVAVEFYRGSERRTAAMTLSARQMPVIPVQSQALAETLQQNYTRLLGELTQILVGVSEEDAMYRPGPEA